MSYAIGIDLGTTFTAAAVCDPGVAPQMLSLGSSGYSVPSVLFLREEGAFLAGEAAELRAAGDPTRVARHFKRRLGDDVPIRLAGTAFDPLTLTRELLGWVLDLVTSRRGEAPAVVVLTHPANWGEFRVDLLRDAVDLADSNTLLISEPAAAAAHYVQGERVEPGELIGVYDLGGGTFDAVVMRRTENGFETAGRAGGIERLGGVDFDDAIWSYVLTEAEVELGADDDATLAAAYDLRSNCVAAKRLLSVDTSADIRVPLRAATSSVRLTRAEFERRIRPRLAESIEAFDDVLSSAGIVAGDLSRILLVGGSSRIPLVGEMLASHFGVPIAVDSDPKNAVALGAAGFGATSLAPVSVASSFRAQTRTVSATPEARRAFTPPAPTTPSFEPTAAPPPTTEPSVRAVPPSPPADLPRPPSPTMPPPAAAPAARSTVAPAPGPSTPPAARTALAPTSAPAVPSPTSPALPPAATPNDPPVVHTDPVRRATRSSPQRHWRRKRRRRGRVPTGPPPAGAPRPPARPAGSDAVTDGPSRPAEPTANSLAPLDPSARRQSSDGDLASVSTESRHRVRTPVSMDAPAVAQFETVPAQAQPVGSNQTLMLAVIVLLVIAIALGGYFVFVK
ncbi:MAG: Hsp70 family protein [Acidimicrobiales bacterium]